MDFFAQTMASASPFIDNISATELDRALDLELPTESSGAQALDGLEFSSKPLPSLDLPKGGPHQAALGEDEPDSMPAVLGELAPQLEDDSFPGTSLGADSFVPASRRRFKVGRILAVAAGVCVLAGGGALLASQLSEATAESPEVTEVSTAFSEPRPASAPMGEATPKAEEVPKSADVPSLEGPTKPADEQDIHAEADARKNEAAPSDDSRKAAEPASDPSTERADTNESARVAKADDADVDRSRPGFAIPKALPPQVTAVGLVARVSQGLDNARGCGQANAGEAPQTIRIHFAKNGRIDEATIETEPLKSAAFAPCLLQYVGAVRLPPMSSDGLELTVQYPLP
jgi:hypothetical protein